MQRSKTEKGKKADDQFQTTFVNKGSTFRLRSPNPRNSKEVRIIKPGQTFQAVEEEIPEALRDVIKRVGPKIESPQEQEIRETKKPVFDLVPKGGGYYNVVNSEGKVMNEKSLRKEEAEELKAGLEGE